MIDWHSHILPGMDDGSQNVAQSNEMLAMLTSQGAETVIATPHFYANDESVKSFLHRRQKSLTELKAQLPETAPEIVLGAEVRYYQGISRMAELEALRIGDSPLLLLEMPVARWTEYSIRELMELSSESNLQIVLAHVERYLHLQTQAVWEHLREWGILMQANAGFFTSVKSRHRALSLLGEGSIHFVGSDCHNTTTRPPHLDKAFSLIEKKLGSDYIRQMNEYGCAMLTK